MRRINRLLGAAIIVIIMTASSSGCGSESPGSPGEPETRASDAVTDAASLVLPLDGYMLSIADYRVITAAENLFVARCMARFGLRYERPKPSDTQPTSPNSRRYGVADMDTAHVRGYRPPLDMTKAKAPEPGGQFVSVLTGRGQRTYAGRTIPDGGCIGEARRALREQLPADIDSDIDADIVQRLAATVYEQAIKDSRVRKAIDQWSACMATKGFDYRTPLDPPGDPMFVGEVGQQEIRIAVADVECKQAVNLVPIWSAVEAAYQHQAIAKHQAALEAVKRANEAQVRVAKSILEDR